MKSALLMDIVVPTRPPTSTLAPAPKITPAGLLMNTCPGAWMRPRIWLGCWPSTRLSVAALRPAAWLNTTLAWLPRSKRCQSMTARWLAWFTVRVLPWACQLAWPAARLPPEGKVVAPGGPALATSGSAASSRWATITAPARAAPWPVAVSGTGTHCASARRTRR